MSQYKVNVEILKSQMHGDSSTKKDVKWSIENNDLFVLSARTSFEISKKNYINISKKITNPYKTMLPYRNVEFEFILNGENEITKNEIEEILEYFNKPVDDSGFEQGQRYSVMITDLDTNAIIAHDNTIQYRYQVDVDFDTTIFIDKTKEFIYESTSQHGFSRDFYHFVDGSIDEKLVPFSFNKVEKIYLSDYNDGYISNKKTDTVNGDKYRTIKFHYTFLTRHILSETEVEMIRNFWKENSSRCSVDINLLARERCEDN